MRLFVVDNIICLMGPTASGKTDLACQWAQHWPFEIISVDSAMIYRGMDIGTAKPTSDILRDFPHHLIDIRTPIETYSAALFCQDVKVLIAEIRARNRIPLLVGGTMMYFHALQVGLNTLPEADPALRAQLTAEALQRGVEGMHAWLALLDPVTAKKLHANDRQRVQRALEVCLLMGQPYSTYLKNETKNTSMRFVNIGLFPADRAALHARIQYRFLDMLKLGFIDEVERLNVNWHLDSTLPSMRSVGYRQALDYLSGMDDHNTFVEKAVAATRQLAKRQLTWLRSWQNMTLVDPNDTMAMNHLDLEKYMT